MQFNSYEFILFFLPLTVFFYYIANEVRPVLGKAVIIISSILFYSYGRINMLVFLGISMAINYCSVVVIRKLALRNKLLLALPIIVNVSLLLYFKYLNFVVFNINRFLGMNIPLQNTVLPLGISFYTFQQIAYIVAAGRGELENCSFVDYLAYILYFPKILMGPLFDPVDFIAQFNQDDRKKFNIDNLAKGIKIFSFGLFKKVLLADTFAKAVSWTYDNIDKATSMDCFLLVLFYTFEIYFDFSGYSDMAVGVSSMLNIELPINFDSPYKAMSIRDFWRRWHISLTKFFTRYIYIPLGGSRRGVVFTYVNTLIVFCVSGLWHGDQWTFVLWGLLHGILSCADRIFDKVKEKIFMPVKWMCTSIVVSTLWLLFSSPSVGQWKAILLKIILLQDISISEGLIETFKIVESDFLYHIFRFDYLSANMRGFNMIIFIIAALFICLVPENNYRNKDKLGIGELVFSAIAFIWGVISLGTESTFVYYGF